MGSGALKMYGRYVRAGKKVLQRERERRAWALTVY